MKTSRPNVLWITTDQQRWDTIAALGNHHINTPNLDRLCEQGVAFTHAYCQNPVCTPSRASFLTGLYPSRIHVGRNGNKEFPDNTPLITALLAKAGYQCGLSGKLHIAAAWTGEEERADDGYSQYYYSHAPHQGHGIGNQYTEWLEQEDVLHEVFDSSNFKPNGDLGPSKPERPSEYHQTAWCAQKAIEFMQQEHQSPWLFSVNIFDPHGPFDPPKKYSDVYDPNALPKPLFCEEDITNCSLLDETHPFCFGQGPIPPGAEQLQNKANYYAMVELIDEQVGKMLDALDATGQRDNTIVIFTSDHGEMIGDHGLTGKGFRFYEGAVRVPLIISWPNHFLSGKTASGLVELTDLAPTLAEMAEVELKETHGQSLVPILTGNAPLDKHHDFVRCEYYRGVHPEDSCHYPPSYATMYRNEQFKLVVYHGNEHGQLYDLEEDPHEFNNLWNAPDFQNIKMDLMKKSFDATVMVQDPGPPRIGRY